VASGLLGDSEVFMSAPFEKTPVIWFPVEMLKARIAERQGDPARPPGDERRGFFRYPCDLEAISVPVTLRKGDCPCQGRVRDISAGGLGVVLAYRYQPGTFLSIELQNRSKTLSRTFVARVVHASALRFGGWQIGCTFNNKLTEDEIRELLS